MQNTCLFKRLPLIVKNSFHKLAHRKKFHSILQFSDFHLTHLKPVKPVHDGSALNKAGRLVLSGKSNGQNIKIFQGHNPQHAVFIFALKNNRVTEKFFPHIFSIQGSFVLAEWMEAINNAPPSVHNFLELQTSLHTTRLDDLPPPGFDYWKDFIKLRFSSAADLLNATSLKEKVIQEVEKAWSTSPQFLMHPDLSESNIVLAKSGQWKIIDNELLTIGGIPLLDLCNTTYSMKNEKAQSYANKYFKKNPDFLHEDKIKVLNAAWLARILGSYFVAGDIHKACTAIENYKNGKNILPFNLP